MPFDIMFQNSKIYNENELLVCKMMMVYGGKWSIANNVMLVLLDEQIKLRPELEQVGSIQISFGSRQVDNFDIPFRNVRVQFSFVEFQMKPFD